MGWGGGRNMCSLTHRLPPTGFSLWFGERSPIISVEWDRGDGRLFFFAQRWGWSANNQVNEEEKVTLSREGSAYSPHFLLLPNLLGFRSRCGRCALEVECTLHVACFTTDWQLVFVILLDLIVPQSDAKLGFYPLIPNGFCICIFFFVCWIRGAILFSFLLKLRARLKRRVMWIWKRGLH